MQFSDHFVWGAASAAYQIEGGAFEDGKGPSIWDHFSYMCPERLSTDIPGDIACDAYHRAEEDLDLMQSLGVSNYRFSLSWPRIFTDRTGQMGQMEEYRSERAAAAGLLPLPVMVSIPRVSPTTTALWTDVLRAALHPGSPFITGICLLPYIIRAAG